MTVDTAIIPCLRYEDAPGAIDYLCRAFGFERHVVYTDPVDASIITHAQLVLGRHMVMLGSVRREGTADIYGWRTAAEAGGVTGSLYVVVGYIEAHYERARMAGVTFIRELHANEGYPGRGYEVRDPEGNVWSFGDYDPWV